METTDGPEQEVDAWEAGFGDHLLGGIVVLMVVGLLMAVFFYLLPPQHLELSELQPAFRVAREADFPVQASRVVDWGEQIILVVRTDEGSFVALQGTAPTDGCILRWDPTSLRVLSPCSYIVYDLHGNVVRGLTTVPLQRFPVFVRNGIVYVARSGA